MKNIEEKQREFIQLYNEMDDGLMQYEFLLQLAGETPLPDRRDEKGRIQNCQTDSWFIMDVSAGRFSLHVDSESLLIRGVLSVYVYLLDGMPLEQVVETPLTFMEETTIGRQMSRDRFAVLSQLPEHIMQFCLEHMEQA